MERPIKDFLLAVKRDYQKYLKDGGNGNLFNLNRVIETAYGNHVMPSVSKSKFLIVFDRLCKEYKVEGLFDHVVEHLFTPIAWSTSSIEERYALKHSKTGKYVVVRMSESLQWGTLAFVLALSNDPFPLLTTKTKEEMDAIMEDVFLCTWMKEECRVPAFLSDLLLEYCAKNFFREDFKLKEMAKHIGVEDDISHNNLEIVKVKMLFHG